MSGKHQHGHTPEVHGHADDWHHHDPSGEGIPQSEHGSIASPATITKWYVGLVGGVAISILALAMYYASYLEPLKKERFEREGWAGLSEQAQNYKQSVKAELQRSGPVEGGGTKISIDAAMDKIVEKYKSRRASAQ